MMSDKQINELIAAMQSGDKIECSIDGSAVEIRNTFELIRAIVHGLDLRVTKRINK